MRWGKTKHGDRWHMIIGETTTPVCDLPMDLIAFQDEPPPDFDARCGNCDNELRRQGREKKPKTKIKAPGRGTVYRPRHTFKE